MTTQQIAIRDNSQLARPKNAHPQRITPRVRQAIEHMVHDAMDMQHAAAQVGLTTYALRLAIGKPHVAAYLKQQMQVLCAGDMPRNIHRLREIRDADNNMPAVNSAKALMELNGESVTRSTQQAAGVTIRIVNVVQQPNTDILDQKVINESDQ